MRKMAKEGIEEAVDEEEAEEREEEDEEREVEEAEVVSKNENDLIQKEISWSFTKTTNFSLIG